MKKETRFIAHYGQFWNGFTLQKGHIYGYSPEGKPFVTALMPSQRPGYTKVYIGRMVTEAIRDKYGRLKVGIGDYVWSMEDFPNDSALVQSARAVLPARREAGITGISKQPLHKMQVGEIPKIREETNKERVPYTGIFIPGGGRYLTDPSEIIRKGVKRR